MLGTSWSHFKESFGADLAPLGRLRGFAWPPLLVWSALALSFAFFYLLTLSLLNHPYLGVSLEVEDLTGEVRIKEVIESDLPPVFAKGKVIESVTNPDGSNVTKVSLMGYSSFQINRDFGDVFAYLVERRRFTDLLGKESVVVNFAGGESARIRPFSGMGIESLNVSYFFLLFLAVLLLIVLPYVMVEGRGRTGVFYFAVSGFGLVFAIVKGAVAELRLQSVDFNLEYLLESFSSVGQVVFMAFSSALLWIYPQKLGGRFPGDKLILCGYALILMIGFFLSNQGDSSGSWVISKPILFLTVFFALTLNVLLLGAQYLLDEKRGSGFSSMLKWLAFAWFAGSLFSVVLYSLPNYLGLSPVIGVGYSRLGLFFNFMVVFFGMYRSGFLGMARKSRTGFNWYRLIFVFIVFDGLFFLFCSGVFDDVPFGWLAFSYFLFFFPLRTALVYFMFYDLEGGNLRKLLIAAVHLMTKKDFENPGSYDFPQEELWRGILKHVFNPITIHPAAEKIGRDALAERGLKLKVVGFDGVKSYELGYNQGIRSRFNEEDLRFADSLRYLFQHVFKHKRAFNEGTAKEKDRIKRGLHDQLIPKLYMLLPYFKSEDGQKVFAGAVQELRNIIDESFLAWQSVEDFKASLDKELGEIFGRRGVGYESQFATALQDRFLIGRQLSNLRGCAMEIAQNAVKYSESSSIRAVFSCTEEHLSLRITDEGKGVDPDRAFCGNGMDNVKARLADIGGRVSWGVSETGRGCEVEFVLRTYSAKDAESRTL